MGTSLEGRRVLSMASAAWMVAGGRVSSSTGQSTHNTCHVTSLTQITEVRSSIFKELSF
jgi:hypothetical protein